MQLAHWQEGEWFEKPGIEFDVLFEDGFTVEKKLTASSPILIRALQPIIEQAETQKRDSVWVTVLRVGEGRETRYQVTEIPPLTREQIPPIDDNGADDVL